MKTLIGWNITSLFLILTERPNLRVAATNNQGVALPPLCVLLIGLQQQLAKIRSCSLCTTDSARNLGFIFDSHLTFSDQISSLSPLSLSPYTHPSLSLNLVIIIFVDFAVSSPILTSKLPVPLPHRLFTLLQLNILQPSTIS